jgi:hypothetical protein
MSETMPTGIHLVFGMVKPQFERARSSATIRCGPLGMVVGTMVTERRELKFIAATSLIASCGTSRVSTLAG